jgi:hypothetical protein
VTFSSKIEQDTGISFFPYLPAELRTKVENDVETKMLDEENDQVF